MSKIYESREEWLAQVVQSREDYSKEQLKKDIANCRKLKWGHVLSHASYLPRYQGLRSFFIDNDLNGLKQHFYVVCKLLMASQQEAEPGGDVFATYEPFLYGLLSDSPEIYDWLAHAEIKDKDYVRGPDFNWYQFQLVLRGDDVALRETIEIAAKKAGNPVRKLSAAGEDFFSLLLKHDKEALQVLIENAAKMKSAHELLNQFLAGYAVILAKLCWYRGIEVEIGNLLVPMPLLPIKPLGVYDVEYDFLRPGWTPPPPPGIFAKIKRLFS